MDPEHRDGKNNEATAPESPPASEPATGEGPAPAAPAGKQNPASAGTADHAGREPKKDIPHEPDEGRALKGKLKKKEHEIRELRKEVHELKDKYLRQAAEMENLRKRLDREKSDYLRFALADILREMLDVLDNFERALLSLAGTENPSTLEGIGLIAKQYMELLRKRGVTEIEADGRPFDPTVHSAVQSVESFEVKDPVVGEVFQKGYRLHDRLLRPALVKVVVPVRS
jgi:molecular chaperone GrpE